MLLGMPETAPHCHQLLLAHFTLLKMLGRRTQSIKALTTGLTLVFKSLGDIDSYSDGFYGKF